MVVQQGLILAIFVEICKLIMKLVYGIGMKFQKNKAINFKGMFVSLLSGLIGILNDGSFDIVIGIYLENLNPDELTGPEKVSYYLSRTLFTMVALLLPFLILWVYRAEKTDLETKDFQDMFSSLYLETKNDKISHILFLYIRKIGFIAIVNYIKTPYLQICILHIG